MGKLSDIVVKIKATEKGTNFESHSLRIGVESLVIPKVPNEQVAVQSVLLILAQGNQVLGVQLFIREHGEGQDMVNLKHRGAPTGFALRVTK